MSKKTLVIGASPNPDRFSNKAIHNLVTHKHETYAIGNREGIVAGVKIHKNHKNFEHIHTVSLYLNPHNQEKYIDYIISLKPKRRIIFNPGTENPGFEKLALHNKIEVLNDCTLVLLHNNKY